MRALLVEDDDRIAGNVRRALETVGLSVEHVHSGEAAWFEGGTQSYDLIILDLGLPDLDGLTVLKRWRGEGIETPVLVLTARGTWTERVEGIDAGADDYLPKPFRMEELIARARALIRRAGGRGGGAPCAGSFVGGSQPDDCGRTGHPGYHDTSRI